MTIPFRHCTVRLDWAQFQRLEAAALTKATTPSAVIRDAVALYLLSDDLMTASQRRLARIGEFQQLALDVIIREQFPDFRNRIVTETDRRMELYHGAR